MKHTKTMYDNFNSQVLCDKLKPIINSCSLWKNQNLVVVFIVNPRAGGFTVKSRSDEHLQILEEYSEKAKALPVCIKNSAFLLHETQYAGHGAVLTTEILESLNKKDISKPSTDDEPVYLIITAGGDGTGLEVQTALTKAALSSESLRKTITEKITVLRLPLGTGNDGSDGRNLKESLTRLTQPSHFALQRVVKVTYQGEPAPDADADGGIDPLPPWYSFNLASVGIDAFITHMTNKMKKVMPGDSYKLWLDIACLFYNAKFPSGTFNVKVLDKDGNVIQEINEKGEFCLLGVSGHRTYGSGQKILPNDNNFCMARQMNVFQMLKMKKKFVTGLHYGSKHAYFNKSEKIVIDYNKNLLVQMDGEAHLLHPAQFPLIMERTEPLIRIIECDDAVFNKGAERIG